VNTQARAGSIRGRYAPSPTGDLHLGNLRTALLAWLWARRAGGRFILRIEDLDLPRVRPGATQRMIADLRWLGLDWDEGPDVGGPYGPYHQCDRAALYDDALARLRAQDVLYPCYCSRAELARIASAPAPGEEGPRYPGTCRRRSARQRAAFERAGRRPAWRFRVPEGTIRFTDALCGSQAQDVAATVGDFIVRRSDGVIAYQLAVVVDDGWMGINQVVRGADLLSSTPRQILLAQALGWPIPAYAHVPLLTDPTGAKLSKREQAAGLGPARAAGTPPEVIVAQLAASAGLLPQPAPLTPREVLDRFMLVDERI
jgi:glutamyl-tRNA synthetase